MGKGLQSSKCGDVLFVSNVNLTQTAREVLVANFMNPRTSFRDVHPEHGHTWFPCIPGINRILRGLASSRLYPFELSLAKYPWTNGEQAGLS